MNIIMTIPTGLSGIRNSMTVMTERVKIFIGEYAVTSGTGLGNLRGAIGEAAWMTGMERNSDIVVMGSYAPLLCNFNHEAWPVNLINFDSYRWYGLPSYYVQEMFRNNQGTVTLPVNVENAPVIKTRRIHRVVLV